MARGPLDRRSSSIASVAIKRAEIFYLEFEMRKIRVCTIFVIASLWCVCFAGINDRVIAASAANEKHFAIEIREPGSSKVLYTGGKTITRTDKGMVAVIWYRSSDRGMLQSETVDFGIEDFRMRAYAFDNAESRENIQIKIDGKQMSIKKMVEGGGPAKETTQQIPEGTVSLEVVDDFVSMKWSAIKGATGGINFPLFVTARGETGFFKAAIKPVGAGSEATQSVEIKPNTWFLNRFVAPMILDLALGTSPDHLNPHIAKMTRVNPVRSGAYKDKAVDIYYKQVNVPPSK